MRAVADHFKMDLNWLYGLDASLEWPRSSIAWQDELDASCYDAFAAGCVEFCPLGDSGFQVKITIDVA